MRGLRRNRTSSVPEIPVSEHRKKSSDPYPLSDKVEKMRQAKRKKFAIRLLLIVLGIGIVAGAIWLLFFSSFFTVKDEGIEITVTDPAGIVNEEQIRGIAQTELGTPVLRLSTAELENQLEEIPEVLDASVSGSFPDGMIVTITAREPVACVGSPESCVGIAADATQLQVSDELRGQLPKISMDLGSEQAEQYLTGLLDAVSALPEDVRGRVQGASISDSGLIEFQLDSGTIKWGPSEENEKKARIVAVLIQEPAGTYDVTLPDAPVTY